MTRGSESEHRLHNKTAFQLKLKIIALAAQSSRLGTSGNQSYRKPIDADSARRRRTGD
jgi:hypothetical protein